MFVQRAGAETFLSPFCEMKSNMVKGTTTDYCLMQINNSIADLKSHSKQELVKNCDKFGRWSELDPKKLKQLSLYTMYYIQLLLS